MKLSLGALLLLYPDADVSAFAPSRRHDRHVRPRALGGAPGGDDAPTTPRVAPVKKKVLTAADVLAKSKARGGPGTGGGSGGASDPDAPGAQEAPKIFPPSTYDDFQSSLLLLEKRAKGGAGSLSADEVRKFEEETGRIISEMREYMADPEGCKARIEKMHAADAVEVRPGDYFDPEAARPTTPETAAATAAAAAATAPPPPAPAAVKAPPKIVTSITPSTTQSISSDSSESEEKQEMVPPSEDDDIPFDESGGFGLARGTTNTYAIPGMDEMSPEEYRAKLQESVSARQAQRRKNSLSQNRGIIGNASSQGYLDGLSGGNKG